MGAGTPGQRVPVLGVPIDALSIDQAVRHLAALAQGGQGGHVCLCNAHSVVTASRPTAFARDFAEALASASLILPDGAPVAWMMRRLGARQQRRVSGPDLMRAFMAHAAAQGDPIYLYGSTPETLVALQRELLVCWPTLLIAGSHSPPFRASTAQEDADDVARINASGARTVWVSLGCPKQELWMAAHRHRVRATMVGVGAAFDFHAGTVQRAPQWMRDNGLEWLHRLACEPRRLWRRYLVTNSLFIAGAMAQWWRLGR